MPALHHYFPNEDVYVTVPFQTYEVNGDSRSVVIFKKEAAESLPGFTRVVINFYVCYVDDNEELVPIKEFKKWGGMDLKIPYTTEEKNRNAILLYRHPTENNVLLPDAKVDYPHQGIKRTFQGYAVTTIMKWPGDPNIGWGGG